ncbi:MAG: hypothetical protein ACI8TP_001917 [Acidimicrobiales bacterium]|jgi:hypothetical protein
MNVVATRGRLNLPPIDGSIRREAMPVEIDLVRGDGTLTVGDLRVAAETFEAHCHHEVAHRLWTAVGLAAADIDAEALFDEATERAGTAIGRVGAEADDRFRQSGVKFDYLAIATQRDEGATATDVALQNGCSISTVARAVGYAAERTRLLEDHPDFLRRLVAESDPEPLALHYGIDLKIMRWIVATGFNRRRS